MKKVKHPLLFVAAAKLSKKGEIMKKQIFRQTFLVLSVAACLIATSTQAQTQKTNTSPGPTGTTSTMDSSTSNINQPDPGMKGSTSETVNSGAGDQAMQESDRNLNAQIQKAFKRDSALREASSSVAVLTHNGVVTLSGTVATEKEKKDLETEIQRITGVNRVQNELQIAPRSSNSTTSPTTSIQ